jgi:hypothetical protein
MASTVDLAEMSVAEKLQLMEQLWDNLSANGDDLVSPSWHGEILAERDRLIQSGEEQFIDWEVAKKQLRAELE